MGEALHTYHRTSMEGRGIHAITTTNDEEAFTMMQAVHLKRALRNLAAFSETITESIQQTHGRAATYRDIADAIVEAEEVLAGKTPKGA
jgi:hypothetical protein